MNFAKVPLVIGFSLLWPALSAAVETEIRPDYSAENSWLCKPGRLDACAIDINVTTILADNVSRIEPFLRSTSEKPVDCFYVYPTVSMQDSEISDLSQESPQFSRVRTQLARYANVCRLYAPMYRQVTLKLMAGYAANIRDFDLNATLASASQYRTAYNDIIAAWKHYLANDNHGRGVILIGHSQGAFILRDLIKAEIEGQEIQKRLISAHLAGVNIATSETSPEKGDFKVLKPCAVGSQTGCFISFSSFLEEAPPPSWSKAFGMSTMPGTTNNCSNPAELSGDEGRLIPYIDASRRIEDTQKPIEWAKGVPVVDTPLIALPAFLKARCVNRDDGAGYLAISFADPDPHKDGRARYIPGHVYVGATLLSNWGVHDADIELTIGNLIKIAARQATLWQESQQHR